MLQLLAGLILLGVLVFVHELGHFLFAKKLGVRVLVFSIGFGPKIWGFKKGDTEYRISAIPLGGYVRMFGENLDGNFTEEEKKYGFFQQKIWRKSLIALAGPLFNFLLPIVLFFFLFLGKETYLEPIVGTILPNSAAMRGGLKEGDQIISVDGKPTTSFSEVAEIVAKHPNQPLSMEVMRKGLLEKPEHVVVTVTPDSVLEHNPFEPNKVQGRMGVMPAIALPEVVVEPQSVAEKAGFKPFDRIVSIDNVKVRDIHQAFALLEQAKDNATIEVKVHRASTGEPDATLVMHPSKILHGTTAETEKAHIFYRNVLKNELSYPKFQEVLKKTHDLNEQQLKAMGRHFGLADTLGVISQLQPDSYGEQIDLKVGEKINSVDGQALRTTHELQQAFVVGPEQIHILGVVGLNHNRILALRLDSESLKSFRKDEDIERFLGITLAKAYETGATGTRRVGPVGAITKALTQTGLLISLTGKSLWMLTRSEVPMSQVGGPIMMFDVAGKAAQKGWSYYIFIMSLISVNLGLLNLLPIPVLDGGHLLLFAIEGIQRKPLTLKTRTLAMQIGMLILLALMGLALFNDLMRLFG